MKQNVVDDPSRAAAKAAGLAYELDDAPGWTRKRSGRSFSYADAHGKHVAAKSAARVDALRIPPAWREVWISPKPEGHLQATGIDKKGIKQYRYHERWSEAREAAKFARLSEFGVALPKLRRAIRKHLNDAEPTRDKVIAAALSLVDDLALRIGSDEYAESNDTYGVTTLQDRHVTIRDGVINLHFIGKSHKEHEMKLQDPRLAKILKEERDMPGERLFQYVDEAHKRHPLSGAEVNAFIKREAGPHFSAKDFRTWTGTAEAYSLMRERCVLLDEKERTEKSYKKSLAAIIKAVSEKLGNTPSVCRAHYVHAGLQELYAGGSFETALSRIRKGRKAPDMRPHEAELLTFLKAVAQERANGVKSKS